MYAFYIIVKAICKYTCVTIVNLDYRRSYKESVETTYPLLAQLLETIF